MLCMRPHSCIATKWKQKEILKGVYNLVKDSPARQEDYVEASGCDKCPLAFGGTRWIEELIMAERCIEIWPGLEKIVDNYKKFVIPSSPNVSRSSTLLLQLMMF